MSEPLLSFADIAVTEVVDAENPWPGLASFEERYERFFYGREREEKILLRRVLRRRLTILTGRSGMGKTSVLRAGLFPRLRRQQIFPVYISLDFKAESASPARQIFDALLDQAKNSEHPVEVPGHPSGESLWEYFHRSDADFWSRENFLITPLLVFDRFEEILDLRGRFAASTKEVEAFLAELADLVEGRPPEASVERWKTCPEAAATIDRSRHNYKILLSLREDFLADLDDWSDDCLPSGSRNRLRLHPMKGERALEAVLGPGKNLVEPEVAERIVRWVAGAGAKDRTEVGSETVPLERLTVEPALLSLVCRELNNKRLKHKKDSSPQAMITEDLLEEGKTTIIEDFYIRCMEGVLPSVRKFVEDSLLLPGGRRDSVALQTVPQEERFYSDLRKLQELRLLRIEPRDNVERVELTHDVLTAAVHASRDARRQREAEEKAEGERHAREVEELNRSLKEARGKAARTWKVAISLIVLGIIWMSFLALRNANLEAKQARLRQHDSETARQKADQLLAVADVNAASTLVAGERAAEGLAFLAQAARKDPLSLLARSSILDLLMHRNWPLPLSGLKPGGLLHVVRFDARGKLLIAASSGPVVRLWSESDPRQISQGRTLPGPLPFSVEAADLSPDGKTLAVAAKDGRWQLWEMDPPRQVSGTLREEAPLKEVVFGPDGRMVLTLFGEGGMRLWDVKSGRPLSPPWHHGKAKRIYAAEFSPDGRLVVSAGDDFTAQVWSVPRGTPMGRPMRHDGLVYSARFSSDGRRVVTASADNSAQVWDVRTGRSIGLRLIHKGVVRWAELSPDSRTVATASWDATARLWDAATGHSLGEPMLHQGRVQSVRFSPNGGLVITASSDGTARLWDARTGRATHVALRMGQAVDSAVFSPGGGWVLTQAGQEALRVWDVEPGRAREAVLLPEKPKQPSRSPIDAGRSNLSPNSNPPSKIEARLSRSGNVLIVAVGPEVRIYKVGQDRTLSRQPGVLRAEGDVVAIAPSPDGSRIAAAWNHPSGRVRVWDTTTGKVILDKEGLFSSVDFSPDGERLAASWWNGRIDFLTLRGGATATLRLLDLGPPLNQLGMIRFGPDGQQLAAAYWDSARVWSLRTGRPVVSVSHLGRVFSAELSPNGERLLVTATSDGNVRETRVATRETLSEILHSVSVWSASFGPEAGEVRRIITVAADGRVRLWEPRSGQMIGDPLEHSIPAVAARFFPDGQSVITVSADGAIRLWDTPTGTPEDADLLANLAEAVGGFQVDEKGLAVLFPRQVDALEDLRRSAASEPEHQSLSRHFLRWFFADRARRTISPLLPIRSQADGAP